MNGSKRAERVFRRLYDAHYGAVLAYCLRRANRADAHDAVADVFTIVWRKIDAVPAPDKERPWLFGIAYRVLGHQWRSSKRYQRIKQRMAGVSDAPEPSPEVVVVRRAQDRALMDAARRLKATDQEILRLAAWEELSHAEIASLLGISVSAAEQRYHRAKRRLAREFGKSSPDYPAPTEEGGGGS